jgi:hypothetical protein
MFEEDKEEWHKLFDYYKQRFGEDTGVICGVLDTEDFEIDLFAGENSGKVYGMRLYQVMELEEGDVDGDEKEEDDEEEESDIMCYDLVATPKAKIQGKTACEATVDLPEEGKDEQSEQVHKFSIKIYTEDGDVNSNVTGAVGILDGKPGSRAVFLEPPELK